jgi:hypothetical protein
MIARIASHDIGVIAKRCVRIVAIEGSLVGVDVAGIRSLRSWSSDAASRPVREARRRNGSETRAEVM